ncbi:MAG: ABC transporter substrate-binding protein [Candidatus Acetothermia bacterium]|jgi:peptide/nickel transport system substrate-binding protein|nr:ABC transporter substrate-binding protein [Candidatus Acetothermia bacterium]
MMVLLTVSLWNGLPAELTVAVSTEPPGLDPTTNAAAVIKLLLQHNLYEGLVQVDEAGDFQGQLARSWEASTDGLVYTFYLREDVRFHDGTPCDADAVRRSFLRAMDPATRHVRPEYYRGIADIEAVDPWTVRFRLHVPDASFVALLALGESVVVPTGADLARRPVGTGPFRFVDWLPGYHLRLARNADYYLPGVPKLDAATFRFLPDPAAQLAALRAGDVDLVAEVAPEIAVTLADDTMLQVISGPQDLVQILAINKARAPFSDLRVRQALAHAVDRDQLIALVSFGFASPIGSHLAPTAPYHADMTWVYPYDPARARELLAEAGYPNGFTATLTLPANYAFHVRTGELIAAQLREVGVTLDLKLVDWGTWLDRVFGQADYDLTVIGHPGRLDPALMLTGYGEDRPDYYFRRGWENHELAELLRLGACTPNPAVRRSIYTVAQYLIAREVVNVFLQAPHQILAMRRGITGAKVLPIYVLDLRDVAKG